MARVIDILRKRQEKLHRPMPFKPRARTRVTGSDLGDFYKDDNGKLWRYETKAGVPAGQVRAVTDQYGGATSPWYDRPVLFGDDHAEVNKWIDSYEPSDSSGDGGSSDTPTKTTPKPSGGGVTSKTIAKAMTPVTSSGKSPSGWGYLALLAAPASGFMFAGPVGAGIGLGVGIAALLASRK